MSDAIQNYKTVASFGHDDIIVSEYSELLIGKVKAEAKAGCIFGLSYGLSQAVINLVFGVLYLASGEMYYKWPESEFLQVDNMYIAMFCLLFGAFTAGQAMQFGPDVVRAKSAAMKIYAIIDRPSKIDKFSDS